MANSAKTGVFRKAAAPKCRSGKILPALTLSALFVCAAGLGAEQSSTEPTGANAHSDSAADPNDLLYEYCGGCHNDDRFSGGWSLADVDISDVAKGFDLESWEKILHATRVGDMPPADKDQFSAEQQAFFVGWLESQLDDYSRANPDPGRATLRRLNRAEYSNAVRDLLALDLDVREQLPADDSGYGFDNIADVLTLSPTLMDRYMSVSAKVSALAVGIAPKQATVTSYAVPKDGSILNRGVPSYDMRMSDQLPLDSRGGGHFDFYAPYDGRYEISAHLNANTNNEVDRLEENRVTQEVELKAGAHSIGVSFKKQLALDETVQTLNNDTSIVALPTAAPTEMTLYFTVDGARVAATQVPSYHMSSRFAQVNFLRDVLQIDIEGPIDISGLATTPSRKKIFSCRPESDSAEQGCAMQILSSLARQAYRRPITDQDLQPLMQIYSEVQADEGFERAVATAIQAILVSPSFLFLYEQDPLDSAPGQVQRISDLEFASRLALFLWSSLPDEQLLNLAEDSRLRHPDVLKQQVERMLLDPRAEALTENFAGQWLYLRNIENHRPDVFEFPDFDIPLRQAIKRETELFFEDILKNNRSILNFLDADYSYLNQRLAEHYGVEGIQGSALRKVYFDAATNRGGLLGQASILTLTSYGNHTSPVKRGQWILENLLAAPPPPAPPDVAALVATNQEGKKLNAREQMALHRDSPACASCHVKMDPLGLALEQYDAIGAFRTMDAGRLIDASTAMPDGKAFTGLAGLHEVLLDRKDQFTRAFTERLLTYALGRGLQARDQPKVRSIARSAAENDYRVDSIILGIVNSEPFNYRKTAEGAGAITGASENPEQTDARQMVQR